jgi:hypothetical protein
MAVDPAGDPGPGALALLGRLDGEARDHARRAFDDQAV